MTSDFSADLNKIWLKTELKQTKQKNKKQILQCSTPNLDSQSVKI